ncbi:MAG: Na+/H+ antiporter NhaC family protein [Bacteroidota bacterium]
MEAKKEKNFKAWELGIPFFVSLLCLSFSSYWFGSSAGEGPYQLSLLLGTLVVILVGTRKGIQWNDVKIAIKDNIKPIIPTLIFLVLIGAISVVWLISGIIPSAIYYGLYLLKPAIFLPAVALFAGLMALACGSSWLTVGTIGVAFLGIGNVLGFPLPLVAGAIISGAYFGDKLTPLSETTVLASSMTKTPLLTHVRYMLWTSIPAFLISLALFSLFGLWYSQSLADSTSYIDKQDVMQLLDKKMFTINALFLLIPVGVIVATMLGYCPLRILFGGIIVGALMAWYFQFEFLDRLGYLDNKGPRDICLSNSQYLQVILKKICIGMELEDEENEVIKSLFSNGGIWGMWPTITIIIFSVIFCGVLEGTGLLQGLMDRVMDTSSRGKLMALTIGIAIFFNITVADQYLAIILTCKMFDKLFQKQGLSSENLSRTVEDAATVTSPLVPWNTCGAAQARVLGISTLAYAPFCFFNILSPIISIIVGIWGFKIAYTTIAKEDSKKKKHTKKKFVRIKLP